jgi:hypothetical protein
MRESKAESISRIAKLMEFLHDVSIPSKQNLDREDGIVEKMRKLTDRFEFEVRTELARIGAHAEVSDHESTSNLAESVERICQAYQDALSVALTAHTRAMLNRQFEEIRKMRAEFIAAARAA